MWEADKQVLEAYKQCFNGLIEEMKDGGDVDLSSACASETAALQSATAKAAQYYMEKHPSNLPEFKKGYYNP